MGVDHDNDAGYPSILRDLGSIETYARPFEDKPEDIVNLALDALDEKKGRGAPPKPMMPPQANALKVAYAARASGAPEPATRSEHV